MQQNKIILIGKSEKFYDLVKSIYPGSSIEVLSWRKISEKNGYSFKKKNKNLIFVNGYHYGSSYFFF